MMINFNAKGNILESNNSDCVRLIVKENNEADNIS